MKAKLLITLLLFACLTAFSCSKDDNNYSSSSSSSSNNDCQTDQSKRRGARCKDGTESTATGSGACSGHGGVDYWLCK